jgi:hypothetical protein
MKVSYLRFRRRGQAAHDEREETTEPHRPDGDAARLLPFPFELTLWVPLAQVRSAPPARVIRNGVKPRQMK